MNTFRFLAKDAADAISQIRAQLGPEAVVLSVNPLPVPGVGRLFRKPRLEVLAGLPETTSATESQAPLSDLDPSLATPLFPTPLAPAPPAVKGGTVRPERAPRPNSLDCWVGDAPPTVSPPAVSGPIPGPQPFRPAQSEAIPPGPAPPAGLGGSWRSAEVLHQMGLLPLYVETVLEKARATHGDAVPATFAQELAAVRSTLISFWRSLPAEEGPGPALHVFVGPPGSGKTTTLCKWLTKSVLGSGRKTRAWRLDGRTANFPGLLDFFGEILGVPVEREWPGPPLSEDLDLGFIDLPGVSILDTSALDSIHKTLQSMPQAQVHLVLNAAYDVSVLLAQARGFASLPVTDLILTHLDEERKRGKLWNLVLGTNFAVRFLSGGQNIPGDFQSARPERLLSK